LRLEGELWHHRDFLRFWTGDTLSQFLTQVSGIAIPTIAIKLFAAGPLQIGLLIGLTFLPFPTLGMFVGVWADRLRRKPIMVIANLVRASALASIPVAYAAGVLGFLQLYCVVLVMGVCTVFFDVSYQSYLPSLIDRADLVEGNSKLQASASVAQPGGQLLAGVLFAVVGYAESMVADVLGYLGSAVALLTIRKPEPKPEPASADEERSFFREMREGAGVVFHNSTLTRIAICTATSNFGSSVSGAAFLLYVYDILKIDPKVYTLAAAAGAMGATLGAIQTASVTRRIGLGRAIALGSVGGISLAFLPLGLLVSPLVVVTACLFAGGWFTLLYNINQVSLRQSMVPLRLQGRMNATMRTIVWGTLPLGSFVGGVLGELIGLQNTILLGAAVSGVAIAFVAVGPVVKLKKMPEQTSS
jgi:MFS family permease